MSVKETGTRQSWTRCPCGYTTARPTTMSCPGCGKKPPSQAAPQPTPAPADRSAFPHTSQILLRAGLGR